MRDFVLFYINGARHEIRGADVFRMLTDYLRYEQGMTGTKVVCAEGDCGACSVILGTPPFMSSRAPCGAEQRAADPGSPATRSGLVYRPVNACIQALYQLDGQHIITVEGLKYGADLHPVQAAMVEHHGAQCGYCTPGFVVAMSCLADAKQTITDQDVRDAVTGNLCRCTGYEPIIRAGCHIDTSKLIPLAQQYPPAEMLAAFAAVAAEPVEIITEHARFCRPTSIQEAVMLKAAHAQATVVAGGTDINVFVNKRGFAPTTVLSTLGLSQLQQLAVEHNTLIVGGAVTLATLETWAKAHLPELGKMLDLFGAPQIKNAATLAGNIANGSPIADTVPFLFVTDAAIEVVGSQGARKIDVGELYTGYKALAMAVDELIVRIHIPMPKTGEVLKLYKVSRRRNLDISTFTAAMLMTRTQGKIDSIKIAYGGVGPVVLRLPKTEAFLRGKDFHEATFVAAGDLATQEITPIADVRGSDTFRYQLARNVLRKFYYECR